MLLFVIQLFFLYLGNIAVLSKKGKKSYSNNHFFLKVSGLYIFFLEKRVIYKSITVLIYFVFFATLVLSYFDGIKFSFVKDLLIKTILQLFLF